jgi:putative flavoprotein involved in K+ transport
VDEARGEPSLQLIGSPEHRSLDLGVLRTQGINLVGRARGAAGDRVILGQDLGQAMIAADARLRRTLGTIDAFIEESGLGSDVPPPEPIRALTPPPETQVLDLDREGIRTVVWATGYRRSYPWLRVPVLDARGEIRHREGRTPAPGLFVLGLQFLRTRKSTFIDGVGDDAAYLAECISTRRGCPVAA